MKKGNRMKLLFGAYLYATYTKDGLVIANAIKVKPYTLWMWSQLPDWKQALAFWNTKYCHELEGEDFHRLVKSTGRMRIRMIMTKSISKARALWKLLARHYDIEKITDILDIDHDIWTLKNSQDKADRQRIKTFISERWFGQIDVMRSLSNKEILYRKQQSQCAGCRESFRLENLTKDHIVPKSRGGGNDISNLQLLCQPCNILKGSRTHDFLLSELETRGIIQRNGDLRA